MSLVAHYQFLDASNLGLDSSSRNLHANTTNITQVSDPERGLAASFNGSTSTLESIANVTNPIGSSTRTVMAWIKFSGGTSSGTIVNYGISSSDYFRVTVGINGSGNPALGMNSSEASAGASAVASVYPIDNVWAHVAFLVSGSTLKTYINGTRIGQNSTFGSLNTSAAPLRVGYSDFGTSTNLYFSGLMTDVRLYSGDATGSLNSIIQLPPNIPFGLTPYSTFVNVSWLEQQGAVSYRVTVDSGQGEVVLGNNLTSTTTVIYNLQPSLTYTFRLYYSVDGLNYTLKETASTTMLADTEANSNLAFFLDGTFYDLTALNRETRSRLEPYLNSLTTGNEVVVDDTRFTGRRLTLVTNGSTSTIPSGNSILLPFNENDGSSQNVTIELSDTSNVTVTYDDLSNEINVGGTTYSEGDVFVLDGKKVTVFDV